MSTAASSPASAGRERSVLTSGVAMVVYVALARVVIYFLSATHYGYFRDELYYLACGEHPAWGYVDQPPLVAWVAWLLEHTIGTSLWALRLPPALAGIGTIVLAGLLARELGGRRWAMFMASLACLMAPVLLAMSHLFTMNAFDPLLWTAIAWLIVRIAKDGDERLWVAVGVAAGMTILNKYAVIFWLVGLLAGICLTGLRGTLRHRWFWIGIAITCVIALPNLLWQWKRQFPFLQLMHNIRENGRDIALPPLAYLGDQAKMLGLASAVLVVLALVFFFAKQGKRVRVLGWAYLVFLAEMMALHGKGYYVAPVYPMMFAAGAAWMDPAARGRAWAWTKVALPVAVVAIGGLLAPTLIPVLTVPQFLAYEKKTGMQQQKFEHSEQGVLPQLYADMFGWPEMAERVAKIYHSLPLEEQRKTAIFGNDYGEAAAIDFFGPRYGLPKAIGAHQNYWVWGPREYTGENMIVIGEGNEGRMQSLCTSYSVVGDTKYPLSRPDEWLPIYDCHGFHADGKNLQEAWPELKRWN